jgi:hypothetical protein
MPQTEVVMDTSILDEVVHWIKTLTAAGVSPDKAAEVTTKFFIAADVLAYEEGEEEEEYYDEDN